MKKEIFISVDIETSGPIPGDFSILEIGACLIGDEEKSFECLLKPTTDKFDPDALKAIGANFEDFKAHGIEAHTAISNFHSWLNTITVNATPIFVGFNCGFDWSFINYYFHNFLGLNPFGHTALDIKSMFFGRRLCTWEETRSSNICKAFGITNKSAHRALDDAKFQAKLFKDISKLNDKGALQL